MGDLESLARETLDTSKTETWCDSPGLEAEARRSCGQMFDPWEVDWIIAASPAAVLAAIEEARNGGSQS